MELPVTHCGVTTAVCDLLEYLIMDDKAREDRCYIAAMFQYAIACEENRLKETRTAAEIIENSGSHLAELLVEAYGSYTASPHYPQSTSHVGTSDVNTRHSRLREVFDVAQSSAPKEAIKQSGYKVMTSNVIRVSGGTACIPHGIYF